MWARLVRGRVPEARGTAGPAAVYAISPAGRGGLRKRIIEDPMTTFQTRAAALVAALLLSLPAAAQEAPRDSGDAAPDSTWREHYAAGEAAQRAGDWGAWRYQLVRVREQVGYHPSVVLNLARADARLGRTEDAIEWLRAYAASGLTADVAADTALASVRTEPGWAAIAERIAANRQPVGSARVAFTLPDSAFLAEGVAFDARSGRFFLSSLRHGSIAAYSPDGTWAELVPARRDGQWSMLALAADTLTRTLWATTAASPLFAGYQAADSGRSAVLAYDLDTGALRRRYDPPAEGPHTLGDMAVAPDGTVYVSDADEGVVYRIERGATEMERFAAEGLVSPQGIAVSGDGRRLFVADYVRGIAIVDRQSSEVTWVQAPDSIAISGIDGLVRAGRGLVALQNGVTPKRVVYLELDAAGTAVTGWRALESGTPLLTQPTHAVVVGGEIFFIADSGWERIGDDGAVKPGMVLEPAHVLRTAVP